MGIAHIFALGSLAFTLVIILIIIYSIVTFIRWLFGQNYIECPCCKGLGINEVDHGYKACHVCRGHGVLRERHARRWMSQKAKGAV